MSIWKRISEALAALASGEGLAALWEAFRTPPEKSVTFTIAVIALGAKLAKADGRVTRDEVAVFRSIFTIPPGEEANAARVFNLARQDVAGFDAHARRIARLFPPGDPVLENVLEGLFHIAMADDHFHPDEDAFLHAVAEIFGVPEARYECIRARIVHDRPDDPYLALGVSPEAGLDEIRAVWRRAVRDNHPDRLRAQGVPEEAARLAEARLANLNRAFDEIERARAA